MQPLDAASSLAETMHLPRLQRVRFLVEPLFTLVKEVVTLDRCLPVALALVSYRVAIQGLRAEVWTLLGNVLCCCWLYTKDGRGFSFERALRFSFATYCYICFDGIQSVLFTGTVSVEEQVALCYWMNVFLWSGVASCWTLVSLSRIPSLGSSPGSQEDVSCPSPCLSPSAARYLHCACAILQIAITAHVTVFLFTCACVPMLLFDRFMVPRDCSRVDQSAITWASYSKAVLSLFYVTAYAVYVVKQALSSLVTTKYKDCCTIKGGDRKSSWRQEWPLVAMAITTIFALSFLGPFSPRHSNPSSCLEPTRVTVPPQNLPRLYAGNNSIPCNMDLTRIAAMDSSQAWTWNELEIEKDGGSVAVATGVAKGGSWRPRDCAPWQRVAILIPYRDRQPQLLQLLARLHPLLQHQQLQYQVFVVEQTGEHNFNRGKIKNVAFLEASRQGQFDCFVFHDVDMVPERQDNLYMCDPRSPRHLSPALDELRYHLISTNHFGGVVAFTGEQFRKVNGYPTIYWGWGAEDDDLSARVLESGMKKSQPPMDIGRYKMFPHRKDTPLPMRRDLLFTWKNRWSTDGLSSMENHHQEAPAAPAPAAGDGGGYTLVWQRQHPLHTHLLVSVGSPPPDPHILSTGPRISGHWWEKFTAC